jgi:hypothetical protein
MKKQLLYLSLLLVTANTISAQITNTFPLDDSVGIGTTSPTELLHVLGNIKVNDFTLGVFEGSGLIYGYDNLTNNTTGVSNTAFGSRALRDNTTGSYNLAFGGDALQKNLSGTSNIAIGLSCLVDNETGSNNLGIGQFTLDENQSGNGNTAIGNTSMASSFKGDYCTAVGSGSLNGNTKGDFNTAFGAYALDFNKSGNNNTAIGYNSDVSSIGFSNATAIGSDALVDASNKVRIGNASVSSNGGQVSWTAYSDARIKTKVKENVPGLEFINLLKPVTYHFDVDKQNEIMGVTSMKRLKACMTLKKSLSQDFLAQDVETAAKKSTTIFPALTKAVKY